MKTITVMLCVLLLCFAPSLHLQQSARASEELQDWIVPKDVRSIYRADGPYNVIELHANVTVDCGSMDAQQIIVSEDCVFYESIDGVLYTDLGRQLVSYPYGRKETECTIPEGVVRLCKYSMAYWALWAMDSGEEVTVHLPSSLERIDEFALECSGLTTLELPENLVRIYRGAFEECKQLASVTFPSSLKVIGEDAFYLCALTEVHLNEGLVLIDSCAFGGNDLTDVYLPPSIGYIDNYAFCDNWAGPITFHVYEGSYAEEWAIKNGENYCYITE